MSTPPIDYAAMIQLLQAWDTDGDGLVSSEDFKQGLSSIGFQISAHDADTLCRALDSDGTGNIRTDSLAELLEQPATPSHAAVPPPAPAPSAQLPIERGGRPSLDATLNDGSSAASASVLAPELRAWEALAAADPAAAANVCAGDSIC